MKITDLKPLLKKRLTLILIAACIFLWVGKQVYSRLENNSLSNKTTPSEENEPSASKQKNSVSIVRVQLGPMIDSIPAHGVIAGKEIKLRFENPGVVEAILKKVGDTVKKGEILAKLDSKDSFIRVEHRRAKLEAHKIQLKSLENKLQMFQQLYESGYLLKAKLKEVHFEKENKEKEIQALRMELLSAEREVEKNILKAPCEGVITKRWVEVGEVLLTGEKVATLVNTKNLFLELNVTERYAASLQMGQKVEIKAYPHKEILFGRIEAIVPHIEGKSRTFKATVQMEQMPQKLLPGMFVQASILLYENKESILIPVTTLKKKGNQYFVLVLTQDLLAEHRPVRLGYTKEEVVEVLEGLKKGERVILDSTREVQVGEPLQVVSEK